jgi:hypothetical protein
MFFGGWGDNHKVRYDIVVELEIPKKDPKEKIGVFDIGIYTTDINNNTRAAHLGGEERKAIIVDRGTPLSLGVEPPPPPQGEFGTTDVCQFTFLTADTKTKH